MEDVELVLRFFAYRFIDEVKGNTIEEFLDEYLKKANKFPKTTLDKLESLFTESIETIYQIFGEDAFLPPVYERKVNTSQKTVYDPLMQSMAKNINKKKKLLQNAKKIRENKFKEEKIIIDGKKVFDGRDNIPSTIKIRIQYFDELFNPYTK